jgi:hypothetical protein
MLGVNEAASVVEAPPLSLAAPLWRTNAVAGSVGQGRLVGHIRLCSRRPSCGRLPPIRRGPLMGLRSRLHSRRVGTRLLVGLVVSVERVGFQR